MMKEMGIIHFTKATQERMLRKGRFIILNRSGFKGESA
jgi:hypothetical protein